MRATRLSAICSLGLSLKLLACGESISVGIDPVEESPGTPDETLDLSALPPCPTAAEAAPQVASPPPPELPMGWQRLPGSVSSSSGPWNADAALDAEGHPVVATIDGQTRETPYVHVWRWDGSAWLNVGPGLDAVAADGGSNDASRIPGEVSLAADAAGRPFVAWSEAEGAGVSSVYACAWDGAAWRQLGTGLRARPGAVAAPSLRLDRNGSPTVAWSEIAAENGAVHVQVASWADGGWRPVGDSPDAALHAELGPASNAGAPSLRLDRQGAPTVAWSESVPQPESPGKKTSSVHVARWNGAQWQRLGEALGLGDGASLDLTAEGSPVVGWVVRSSFDGLRSLAFARWTGAEWVPLPSPGVGVQLDFVLDGGGRPVVAREVPDAQGTSFALEVRRLAGETWELLGTGLEAVSGSQTDTYQFMLAVDGADRATVAWIEYLQPPKTRDNVCGLFVAQQR